MEATYALVNCENEWILLSSLKDYNKLHSLATIRKLKAQNNSWEVVPPFGQDLKFVYDADSPLNAARSYLRSMGMDGNIELYS